MKKLIFLLLLYGVVAYAGILDGNFNTGWTVGGTVANSQVLTTLGPFTATGPNFALLSNGPGALNAPPTVDSTTLTSIQYMVALGATLTLSYDLLSSEGGAPFGNPDPFSIEVLGSSTMTLAFGDATGALALINGGPIAAPDGSSFIYETGFQQLNAVSLDAFAGQTIALQFSVADASDNSFDTGLLIDGISATGLTSETTAPVPEPTGLSVMVLVVAAFYIIYRQANGSA
jgi:hypothetical protein